MLYIYAKHKLIFLHATPNLYLCLAYDYTRLEFCNGKDLYFSDFPKRSYSKLVKQALD